MNEDIINATPLQEESIPVDYTVDDEVEVLGTEMSSDDALEVDVETASDFLGDDAAFVEILETDMDNGTDDDLYSTDDVNL
ncbi:MAG: hypothetical protein IJ151_00820 [Bacteroidales bacterium]|nr:hypothetical protein [Bacteroidales bacterium]